MLCLSGVDSYSLWYRSLYSDIVYVDVGPQKYRFHIHKGLLCHHSKYFRAAFGGLFSEAATGVVHLPDNTPETFDNVRAWLYSNQLTTNRDGEDRSCNNGELVDVFIFGDKYDMPKLCNKANDQLLHNFMDKPSKSLPPSRIYANTPPGSPLRKLIVTTYVRNPGSLRKFYEQNSSIFLACPEFLLDLAEGYEEMRQVPSEKVIMDRCLFHRHAEGEGKCT